MITGLALINEVEDRLGWPQTTTLEGDQQDETRKLLRLLNRVLVSMQSLDDWPLLRTEGHLQLLAAETGTWDNGYVIQGTTTLGVGASDAMFNESYIGRAIVIGSEATIYRIVEVKSDQLVVLNKPWTGTSQRTGELTYTIVQDRYQLPQDFDRPTESWNNFFGTSDIEPIGPSEFMERRQRRAHSVITGDPEVYTVYGLDKSNTFQLVHFDYYPEKARVLSFSYQKNHPTIETDEDRVLYPKTHEGVVIEAMLQLANRDYEDSDKSQVILQDLIRSLNQAQGPGNVGQDRMSFSPSGNHRIAQRRGWAGGSRMDWGTAFDQANRVGFR